MLQLIAITLFISCKNHQILRSNKYYLINYGKKNVYEKIFHSDSLYSPKDKTISLLDEKILNYVKKNVRNNEFIVSNYHKYKIQNIAFQRNDVEFVFLIYVIPSKVEKEYLKRGDIIATKGKGDSIFEVMYNITIDSVETFTRHY